MAREGLVFIRVSRLPPNAESLKRREFEVFDTMSKAYAQSDTLHDTEMRLRGVSLAVFVICAIVDVFFLFISAGSVSLVFWLLLVIASIAVMTLNLHCLLANGPTIGMIPISLCSLAPAALSATRAFAKYSGPWWATAAISSAAFALSAYLAWWFTQLAKPCEKQVEPATNAVLLVLGGRIRNGNPVVTVQNRLIVAADLWREAPGRTIVLSGGDAPDEGTTEAEAMRGWIMEREGVPERAILLETRAGNTTENISYSMEVIAEAGLSGRQVCIVTSNYHLYRALAIAQRTNSEIIGVPAPVPKSSALQQWCREVMVILAKGLN